MARYQVKKRGFFSLDMAAFCDIGFLLLSFFMATQLQSREYLNTQVDAPETKQYPICSIGNGNELTVVITPDNKYFIELPYYEELRETVLIKMGKLKGVDFTKEETAKFATIDRFGVSVAALKSLIHGYTSPKDILVQQGIPVNNNQNNELTDWLEVANHVMYDEHGYGIRVMILGDKNVPYPYIAMLTNNLQRHSINKFSLITQAYHYGAYNSWTEYP